MINYKFIGWCNEDNHDKVWVAIMLHESDDVKRWDWGHCKWVTIWGRRGKKLQSKVFDSNMGELTKQINSKKRKGYSTINRSRLAEVYPEFESDIEKTVIWNLLKG